MGEFPPRIGSWIDVPVTMNPRHSQNITQRNKREEEEIKRPKCHCHYLNPQSKPRSRVASFQTQAYWFLQVLPTLCYLRGWVRLHSKQFLYEEKLLLPCRQLANPASESSCQIGFCFHIIKESHGHNFLSEMSSSSEPPLSVAAMVKGITATTAQKRQVEKMKMRGHEDEDRPSLFQSQTQRKVAWKVKPGGRK